MVVDGFRLIFHRPPRLVRQPGSMKRGIARRWSWSLLEASTWTQLLPTDTGCAFNLSVSYRCYRLCGRSYWLGTRWRSRLKAALLYSRQPISMFLLVCSAIDALPLPKRSIRRCILRDCLQKGLTQMLASSESTTWLCIDSWIFYSPSSALMITHPLLLSHRIVKYHAQPLSKRSLSKRNVYSSCEAWLV